MLGGVIMLTAHDSFITWDWLLDFVAEDSLRHCMGPSPLRGSTFSLTIPFEAHVVMEGETTAVPVFPALPVRPCPLLVLQEFWGQDMALVVVALM